MAKRKPKRNKKPKSKPVSWEIIAYLCKEVGESIYPCPLCDTEVPSPKRNLRNHLRDDHTQSEAISYTAMWTDYHYEDGEAADVDIDLLMGKNLKIRLEGTDIAKKIKHCGVELNYENISSIRNSVIGELVDCLTDIITNPDWMPIEAVD